MSTKFWDVVSRIPSSGDGYLSDWLETNLPKHILPDSLILDFGCGPGSISLKLCPKVEKVIGVDVSKKMLEKAQQLSVNQNISNIEFYQISEFENKCNYKSFDAITSFNVLMYVENRTEVLLHFHELLKSKGIFISLTACFGEQKTAAGFFVKLLRRLKIMPKTRFESISQLEADILAAGFTIVESFNLTELPERLIIAQKD